MSLVVNWEKLKEKLKGSLRAPNDGDRVFVKGKVVEAFFAMVSYGIPLLRTEGVGDVTAMDIATRSGVVSVPAILPEKIQAKLRREILEKLRASLDGNINSVIRQKYRELGFLRIGEDEKWSWNCFIAPPFEARGETDLGMCGYCPSCTLLGTIITDAMLKDARTTYGVKSRVVHEIAFATRQYKDAVVELTHNRVGDGVSYTGQSLFSEPHVLPGVVFIGKIALYDVTEKELKLVLSALADITRIGAGETKYGRVKTVILGVKGGSRETLSSYEVARHLLETLGPGTVPPEKVLEEALNYISKFNFEQTISLNKGTVSIDELSTSIDLEPAFFRSLWEEDNYYMAKAIVDYIRRVEGQAGGGGRKGKKRGESGG